MRGKQAKKLRKQHLPKLNSDENKYNPEFYKVASTKNIQIPFFNGKGELEYTTLNRKTIINTRKMMYQMAKRLHKAGLYEA